ncbi:MAG: hypothetical protein N3G20_02690, partial [Verrucomicrobiae bacterium]|nr:hypothetical protein [Verrucomicrobiae bacterium]
GLGDVYKRQSLSRSFATPGRLWYSPINPYTQASRPLHSSLGLRKSVLWYSAVGVSIRDGYS